MHESFPPVTRPDARLLILGSLPGAASLARGRYYAHPRNQFWRLVGAVIGADLVERGYRDRLESLLDARVGLWDSVAQATRPGSLDAAIRNHHPSDLGALVESLPSLRAIGFNGGTSARIGRKALGDITGIALIDLPSSSPAYTLRFEDKLAAWLALRDYL